MDQFFAEHFMGLVGNAENMQNYIKHFDNSKTRQQIRGFVNHGGVLVGIYWPPDLKEKTIKYAKSANGRTPYTHST